VIVLNNKLRTMLNRIKLIALKGYEKLNRMKRYKTIVPYTSDIKKEKKYVPTNPYFNEWLGMYAPARTRLVDLTDEEQDRLSEWMIAQGDDVCVSMLLHFATNEGKNYLSIHSQPNQEVVRVNLFCNRDCFEPFKVILFNLL